MKVMVTGGTGTTGSQVVRELLARGVQVKILTRSAERAKAISPRVEAVVGDLLSPSDLRPAFEDIDALFLLLAGVPSEAHEGLTAVALARAAGVKRIVYLSVHQTARPPRHVPHIGSKLLIESVIRDCGVPYIFLRPNVFMQNDYWYRDALLGHAIYPQPLGDLGASLCDVRDIAEAAAIVLTTDGHDGQAYTIAGPEPFTGKRAAALWSAVLGKAIAYGGHDMERWEQQQLTHGAPQWFALDLKMMFTAWQTDGLVATDEDLRRLVDLLGHSPRSYEDFVAETVAGWPAGQSQIAAFEGRSFS